MREKLQRISGREQLRLSEKAEKGMYLKVVLKKRMESKLEWKAIDYLKGRHDEDVDIKKLELELKERDLESCKLLNIVVSNSQSW